MAVGFNGRGSERRSEKKYNVPSAWVWSEYQLAANTTEVDAAVSTPSAGTLGLNGRTKRGLILGGAVLAGLISLWLSVLLLALAVFLIAWGQDPKRAEEFVRGLPFGDYMLKGLTQADVILSSRAPEE